MIKNNISENKNPYSKMEEEVLDFWEKSRTFEKSVKKKAPKGPSFAKASAGKDYVFYDGPPFITGLPHYATLLPSIAKDVVPRYWTMKGYRVERVWGWDCHGLPAENKVEEQLGLKNKKDIEKLGVGKFVDACRDYVTVGSEQWEWYINRIARWVDMKNAYKTMDLNFMESVIWSFKELYDKGLIYEGYRSSLHCPRCATPLSKFEITMDAGSYRDVEDESVVVKFKLKTPPQPSPSQGEGDTYILAWTTTPWTLPGNLALAVGEKLEYEIVEIEKNYYILAKDKIKEIIGERKHKIVKNLKGKDLVGLEYEPLVDLGSKEIKENKNVFKIYAGDFVSTEDGTGIVHIAPNFGEDDFGFGQKYKLPLVELMDENGIYTQAAGEWSGFYFKKANKKALEDLRNKIFSKFKFTHSYPFCYRCNTALIYKTQKAWYLQIEKIRQKMLKSNKEINWVPEYFKEGRFQYNLEMAPDWCLSRSRYWGSPMPVWKCQKCEEIKVAGSIKEIEKLSGQKVKDLHRPAIDEIELKCQCGGQMKRIPEVLDCWFESGAMPFAQFHYPFEKKKEFEKSKLPADFIIEYTGQLRGWFYYLHVLANALFGKKAFKNVIVSGVLVGTDGRKMSKSYGNYPDPKDTLDKYGGDALRMYFMNSSIMMGDDMNLAERDIQDSLRKNIIVLWNVFKFYELFAEDAKRRQITPSDTGNVLDKWILSRLNQLISEVTENMEKYNLPIASRPITGFIDDLSTWYLRRSRDRFKSDDQADKKAALETTGFVLLQLSKVMAPFMPFMAEQIWQKVMGYDFKDKDKSVHLESWPLAESRQQTADSRKILEDMAVARKIVELALSKRDEAGIKVRQPLNELGIMNQELGKEYEVLIKDELNVKNIRFKKGKGETEIKLDTKLTPELKQEGLKRELVRLINAMRKKQGLTIQDRIVICFSTKSQEIEKAFEKYGEDIKKDVLAEELRGLKGFKGQEGKEADVNGEKVILEIKKK
ncbi:isoleucine--tRNA ligase [Candidatus Falkowbacteria bacterium CG11_big_fil_rev_8_21_14_0_20_39_10]|uniref:Isoleucine--tRNA ligase n=1 Tax=Candidatus Falkowbacteria bacterium CG11_big_fil_rev_8_21_14_0_20_39_10 TaxID=1974570 RepID=A0A2M6K9V0_9BACT|nr:MAG: isoleucine--tRNA ligase [Candidatus Falkowbacteria bacterium CG11_big_fil_rev_8_21_14_0_20_39_10]